MKLFVIVFLVCIPAYTMGIKCFVCFHASPSQQGVKSDIDCQRPHTKYLQECTKVTKLPGHNHQHIRFPEDVDNGHRGISANDSFSCGSLVGYNKNGTDIAVRYCQRKSSDEYDKDDIPGGRVGYTNVCNTDGCNNYILSKFSQTPTTEKGESSTNFIPDGNSTPTPTTSKGLNSAMESALTIALLCLLTIFICFYENC